MGLGAAGTAAAIGAAGSVAGAGASLLGSGKTAGGYQQAQGINQQALSQNIANTAPFVSAGQIGVQDLAGLFAQNQIGSQFNAQNQLAIPMDMSGQPLASQIPQWAQGTTPGQFTWNPTMAGLAATPGYQFTQQQGLQAVQNQMTAQGLGSSGSAAAGAAQYATGLASQTYNQQLQNAESIFTQNLNSYNQGTQAYNAVVGAFGQQQNAYQNQFNDYWANQTNRYNQLAGLANIGMQAATGIANPAAYGAGNVGQAAVGAAQAGAQGTLGVGNTLSSYANSAAFQNWLSGIGTNPGGSPTTGAASQLAGMS